jgi:flavin-dependent dehydrogenase
MEEYDILILGGGPSGLSTALHLHKLAPHLTHRLLILEKERYPRFKLCAGGLVLDAEVFLERLGLDVSEIPHVDSDEIRFDFRGTGLKVRRWRRHALRVIRRSEFDHWLAKKAQERGIQIREGIVVKSIRRDESGVTIITDQGELRAKVIIGADGSNGITRRSILPNEPVQTARVLEVITPENKQSTNAALFDFFPVPENIAGYVWDFPTQVNGQNMRCWGVYDTNILAENKRPALKEPLAIEMKRKGYDLSEYEIKGHPIRWYTPWNTPAIPRVLLVGDAVGADPIFGEGISIALGYGAIAARELADAFKRADFSFGGYKFRLARSGVGQTLFARWLLTYIIYPIKWAWFQVLVWRVFKPVVLFVAWVFVLNWSSRVKT